MTQNTSPSSPISSAQSPATEQRESKETKTLPSRYIEDISYSPLLARHVFECLPPALIPPIRIIICDYIPEIFAWRAAAEDPEVRPLFPQELHAHFQTERSTALAKLWKREVERICPQEIDEEHTIPKIQQVCKKLDPLFLLSWCDTLKAPFELPQAFFSFPYACSQERVMIADLLEEIINSEVFLPFFQSPHDTSNEILPRIEELVQFCSLSIIPQSIHPRLLNTLIRLHSPQYQKYFIVAVEESLRRNAPDFLIIHLLQSADPHAAWFPYECDFLTCALQHGRSYIIDWQLQHGHILQKESGLPFVTSMVRAAQENSVHQDLPFLK